jgi:putative SOS response-associated peptidase YedK
MCGRSTLTINEQELEKRFNATFYSEDLERYNPIPNFNVAPTHMMPVVTNSDAEHISIFKWGLIPFWAKDPKIGNSMINARIESVKDKNTYKSIIEKKRCLVPLDGFYEWKKSGKLKIPYRIQVTDQEIFSCAGLWDSWKSSNGDIINSFTIITLPANEFMLPIHDRMPAILLPEQEYYWLKGEITSVNVDSFLCQYPSNHMKMYPVSEDVNNVRNNSEYLIEPISV